LSDGYPVNCEVSSDDLKQFYEPVFPRKTGFLQFSPEEAQSHR